jgi:hypothetical protein
MPKTYHGKIHFMKSFWFSGRFLSSRRSFMEAKEQFSDGVGIIDWWINDYCATQVTDEQLAGVNRVSV